MENTGKTYGFRVNFEKDADLIADLDNMITALQAVNPKANIKDVIEVLLRERRGDVGDAMAAYALSEFERVTAEMRAFVERLG